VAADSCFATMVEAIDSGWFWFFIPFFFVCARVFSSLTLPISLPYTSRYDPAQEAKVQVLLSLLVPDACCDGSAIFFRSM